MLLATKTMKSMRPAGYYTPEQLREHWRYGDGLKVQGANLPEQLEARKALRDGAFVVSAHQRRGYILLEAHRA